MTATPEPSISMTTSRASTLRAATAVAGVTATVVVGVMTVVVVVEAIATTTALTDGPTAVKPMRLSLTSLANPRPRMLLNSHQPTLSNSSNAPSVATIVVLAVTTAVPVLSATIVLRGKSSATTAALAEIIVVAVHAATSLMAATAVLALPTQTTMMAVATTMPHNPMQNSSAR